MTEFLTILFKKLPAAIFEPVALCGLIGLILAAVLHRKKRGNFYMFFAISLFLMVAGRLAIRILSSRYGLILLIPFTIATSFFCFKVKDICSLFIPSIPQKFLKYLPYICVGLLVLISLTRTMTRRRDNTYLLVGKIVAEDAQRCRDERLLVNPVGYSTRMDRMRQLEYYSGMPVIIYKSLLNWTNSQAQRETVRQLIQWLCHQRHFARDAVYFFIQGSSTDLRLSAQMLNLPEGSWHLIAEKFTGGRRKIPVRVYRYIPPKGTLGKPLPAPAVSTKRASGSR